MGQALSLAAVGLIWHGDPHTFHVPGCQDLAGQRNCLAWARTGQCEANPVFMQAECAASCGLGLCACHRPNRTAGVNDAGVISRIFERIVRERPEYSPRVLSSDPWVLVLDDFITDE